jgi:hypothetical protein
MMQTFDTDLMDDLFYEAAEGPAQMRYDEFDTYDDFDVYDDAFDDYDDYDAMEDLMADALASEDTDEFLRRLRSVAQRVGRAARSVGQRVGQAGRLIAPVARLIPHPAAQAVARVAGIAGRLLADGADELEAFDELVDLAEEEDLFDAAAPTMASLAIHGTMPQQAARLPQPARRQLVRATTQTARTLARQQGPQAVRALPAVVQTAQQTARRQGLSPRVLPSLIRRLGLRIGRNPHLIRRLLRSNPALRQSICAACGGTGHRRPAMRRM